MLEKGYHFWEIVRINSLCILTMSKLPNHFALSKCINIGSDFMVNFFWMTEITLFAVSIFTETIQTVYLKWSCLLTINLSTIKTLLNGKCWCNFYSQYHREFHTFFHIHNKWGMDCFTWWFTISFHFECIFD